MIVWRKSHLPALLLLVPGPPAHGDVGVVGGGHIVQHQLLQLRLRPPHPRLVHPTVQGQLSLTPPTQRHIFVSQRCTGILSPKVI